MSIRLGYLFLLMLGLSGSAYGQEVTKISLNNPSFEDIARHSTPPRGWFDCGFANETAPDTQPNGTFSVTRPAEDGNTYIGMVVRDNDTWEAVSQRLSSSLKSGQCYAFSVYLCRSEVYYSQSRVTNRQANYTTPAKLRIYGGFDHCDRAQMLGETSVVINTRWIEYRFKFEPEADYSHLLFEAFYNTPTLFPYNGNILMDNASDLVVIPCDEDPEVVAEQELEEEQPEIVQEEVATAPKKSASKPETKPTPPKPEPKSVKEEVAKAIPAKPTEEEVKPRNDRSDQKKVIKDVPLNQLKRSELSTGQKIRLKNIYFAMNDTVLNKQSFTTLNQLFAFLQSNKDVEVEVGGHTNGLCADQFCNWLSRERAESVANYLINKGVNPERITSKGYGSSEPIASNETAEGRKKNQRVEIKITGFEGS